MEESPMFPTAGRGGDSKDKCQGGSSLGPGGQRTCNFYREDLPLELEEQKSHNSRVAALLPTPPSLQKLQD